MADDDAGNTSAPAPDVPAREPTLDVCYACGRTGEESSFGCNKCFEVQAPESQPVWSDGAVCHECGVPPASIDSLFCHRCGTVLKEEDGVVDEDESEHEEGDWGSDPVVPTAVRVNARPPSGGQYLTMDAQAPRAWRDAGNRIGAPGLLAVLELFRRSCGITDLKEWQLHQLWIVWHVPSLSVTLPVIRSSTKHLRRVLRRFRRLAATIRTKCPMSIPPDGLECVISVVADHRVGAAEQIT